MATTNNIYTSLYKVVFVTFYRTWKSDDPEWKAALLLPAMIILNSIFIFILLGLPKYVSPIINMGIVFVILYVGLFFLNYLLFIRNKKYIKLKNEFDELDEHIQKREYLFSVLFCIFGYLAPVGLIIFISYL